MGGMMMDGQVQWSRRQNVLWQMMKKTKPRLQQTNLTLMTTAQRLKWVVSARRKKHNQLEGLRAALDLRTRTKTTLKNSTLRSPVVPRAVVLVSKTSSL